MHVGGNDLVVSIVIGACSDGVNGLSRRRQRKKRGRLNGVIESLALLVLLVAAMAYLEEVVLITTLIFLAAISRAYLRFLPLPVGFDLVLLAAYVTYLKFGALAGMVLGCVALGLSIVVAGEQMERRIPSFIALILALAVLHAMHYESTTGIAGAFFAFIFNCFAMPTYLFLGARKENVLVFAVTHILLNYFIFSAFLPFFLKF